MYKSVLLIRVFVHSHCIGDDLTPSRSLMFTNTSDSFKTLLSKCYLGLNIDLVISNGTSQNNFLVGIGPVII